MLVTIDGSNWGGSMLKMSFIGRGMRLEFRHPQFRTIMTSRIVNIRAAEARDSAGSLNPAPNLNPSGVGKANESSKAPQKLKSRGLKFPPT